MTRRMTIERILRDDDDNTGQTVRSWSIQVEAGRLILNRVDGGAIIYLRTDDVAALCVDLGLAEAAARSFQEEQKEPQT